MPVILYIIFYDKVRRKLCRTMHTLPQQVLRAVHGRKYERYGIKYARQTLRCTLG